MKSPTRFDTVPVSIRRSKRIIRMAKSIPGIDRPLSDFEAVVTGLSDAYDTLQAARTRMLIAMADQRAARVALDAQIRGVALAILIADRGRRSSEVFRKCFPNSYGTVLKRSVLKAIEVASGLLAEINDGSAPEILARREPLTNAIAEIDRASANRQAAINAFGEARGRLEERKLAWRKAYNWFYFELRNILSDQRGLVEDLFRSSRRAAGDEEVPEGDQQTDHDADIDAAARATAEDDAEIAISASA
jgi:hypothetical protein